MSTPPIMSTPPFMPSQQTAQDFLTQLLTHQQNTTGMTQVQPNVPPHQVPQPHPFQKQPLQPSQAYGPGQGGAKRSAQMQNFATSLTNLVGTVTQKIQEKKSREQQKVFDNFATYSKGVQDAQGQMQEAKTMLQKAATMGDTPEGKQLKEQGTQMLQQAQQAYQQNVTNLNDLTTGKNEKNSKILAKGYGVDDKNANTPERKAAIAAIQKTNPGMSDKSANLTSHMPATMGLSPQAQQQQTVRQAGLLGNPATQGQVLKALTDQHNQALKHGIDEAKVSLSAYKIGLIPEAQDDGTFKLRPMTQEEKGQYQLTVKGILAWTIKDGKPLAALRNPVTNQIIPGTENPDMLPPAYLTDRLRVGEFSFTDKDGNVWRVPTVSKSTPILPGGKTSAPATGGTSGTPKAGAGKTGSTTTVGAPSGAKTNTPKGARLIGQGKDAIGDDIRRLDAQALVDGRADLKQIASMRSNERERLFAMATSIDPSFTMASFPLRQKTYDAFTNGKQGDQIQSFNTFIGHAGEVDEQIGNLRNYDANLANKPINWLKKNVSGNPAIISYLGAQEAAKKEFESFLLNNHALHESDRQEGQKILNEDQSPAAQEAAIKSFMSLAMVRLESLNQRWKNVFKSNFPNLIEPDSLPVLQRLGFGKQAAKYGSGGSTLPQSNLSDEDILNKLNKLK